MADELSFRVSATDDASATLARVGESSRRAALAVESANLKVEKSAKAAERAEARFGAESLQAREAANRLALAELALAAATRKANDELDETPGAVDRMGTSADAAGDRVERLAKSEVVAGGNTRKLGDDSDRTGGILAKVGKSAAAASVGIAKFGAGGAVAASVAAPLAASLATGAIAAAKFGAEIAPAAAALLPLAAGGLLVQKTFVAMGPAIVKAVEPVTGAFEKAGESAGKLAADGIRPVAEEFVKANFPAVAKAMDRIGEATGAAATQFGDYINSAKGSAVVADIADRTADSYEKLSPKIADLGEALVGLAGRASGTAFDSFTEAADKALDKITKIVDDISKPDVQQAFKTLGQVARTAGDGLRALGSGIQFLDENREKISKFADGMAAAGIVLGIAAGPGGWIYAIGGALSLVVRHFDEIKDGAEKVEDAFSGIGSSASGFQPTLDAFADAWEHIRDGLRDFAAEVEPKLAPFLDNLHESFLDLQPTLTGLAELIGPVAEAMLGLAGTKFAGLIEGVGLVAVAFGKLGKYTAEASAAVLGALAEMVAPIAGLAKKLHLPFADALAGFVTDARNAKDKVNESLAAVDSAQAVREVDQLKGSIKTLRGKKVKTEADRAAIAASEAALFKLQQKINRLDGKTVYVRTIYQNVGQPPRALTGASGGGGYGVQGGYRSPADGGYLPGPGVIPSGVRLARWTPRRADGGGLPAPAVPGLRLASGGRLERLTERFRESVARLASDGSTGLTAPIAMVSGGEYLVEPGPAKKNLKLVEAINRGTHGYAGGGMLSRALGGPREDNVPLGPEYAGYYVVNARQTAKHLPLLDSINAGAPVPKLADGGPAAPVTPARLAVGGAAPSPVRTASRTYTVQPIPTVKDPKPVAFKGDISDVTAKVRKLKADISSLVRNVTVKVTAKTSLTPAKLPTVDAVLARRSAARDYQASLDSARAALKDNGKARSTGTAKGRANQEALDSLATSGTALAATISKKSAGYRDQLVATRNAVERMARSMGYGAKAADDLAKRLVRIPRKTQVDYRADVSDLNKKIRAAQAEIKRLPKSKETKVRLELRDLLKDKKAAEKAIADLAKKSTVKSPLAAIKPIPLAPIRPGTEPKPASGSNLNLDLLRSAGISLPLPSPVATTAIPAPTASRVPAPGTSSPVVKQPIPALAGKVAAYAARATSSSLAGIPAVVSPVAPVSRLTAYRPGFTAPARTAPTVTGKSSASSKPAEVNLTLSIDYGGFTQGQKHHIRTRHGGNVNIALGSR